MTATTSVEAAAAPRSWLRRHRSAALIGAALIAATAVAVVGGKDQQYAGYLDPANTDPGGARAVARVLDDQGISVDIVRDAKAFAQARIDARTTVLVTGTENLGTSTARQVLEKAATGEVILVDPSYGVPELFDADEGLGYSETLKVEANCAQPSFSGLTLETRAGTILPETSAACFGTGEGALLTEPTPGVTFLGAADLLSNEQITRSDNAAIALRLLGAHDHLVWYVPDPADLTGDDGVSFRSLLPDWLGPGMVLLVVVVLALMAWRGRRLGPLAVEPLPVAITAIETTRSRGRLYRKVDDRGYAAGALRASARTEITEHLLLPRHTAHDVDLLVRVLAPYTALDAASLRNLLSPDGPAPGSDKELITLANDLAELSREVRRS